MSIKSKLAALFGKSDSSPETEPAEGAESESPAAPESAVEVEAEPEVEQLPELVGCDTLHACASTPGSAARCRLLLEKGANALEGDVEGRTPLHVAAWLGNLEVLKVLCAEVISVDPFDDYRVSPLLHALRSPEPGAGEAAQYLISKGAKLTLNVAFALGDLHLINRLFLENRKAYEACKAPEELLTDLIRAIRRACAAKTGARDSGADVTEAETAVMDKYLPTTQKVVDAGLDPDLYGIAKRPPLFEAVQFNSTLLAETLLKLGADPNSISQEDETPLQVAGPGRPAMQALLREHGAEG